MGDQSILLIVKWISDITRNFTSKTPGSDTKWGNKEINTILSIYI